MTVGMETMGWAGKMVQRQKSQNLENGYIWRLCQDIALATRTEIDHRTDEGFGT